MFKRKKMNYKSSKRLFSRTAGAERVHPKNAFSSVGISRGGTRL